METGIENLRVAVLVAVEKDDLAEFGGPDDTRTKSMLAVAAAIAGIDTDQRVVKYMASSIVPIWKHSIPRASTIVSHAVRVIDTFFKGVSLHVDLRNLVSSYDYLFELRGDHEPEMVSDMSVEADAASLNTSNSSTVLSPGAACSVLKKSGSRVTLGAMRTHTLSDMVYAMSCLESCVSLQVSVTGGLALLRDRFLADTDPAATATHWRRIAAFESVESVIDIVRARGVGLVWKAIQMHQHTMGWQDVIGDDARIVNMGGSAGVVLMGLVCYALLRGRPPAVVPESEIALVDEMLGDLEPDIYSLPCIYGLRGRIATVPASTHLSSCLRVLMSNVCSVVGVLQIGSQAMVEAIATSNLLPIGDFQINTDPARWVDCLSVLGNAQGTETVQQFLLSTILRWCADDWISGTRLTNLLGHAAAQEYHDVIEAITQYDSKELVVDGYTMQRPTQSAIPKQRPHVSLVPSSRTKIFASYLEAKWPHVHGELRVEPLCLPQSEAGLLADCISLGTELGITEPHNADRAYCNVVRAVAVWCATNTGTENITTSLRGKIMKLFGPAVIAATIAPTHSLLGAKTTRVFPCLDLA